MRLTKIIMGMPVTLDIVDENVTQNVFDKVFNYFIHIDNKFSTYKSDSEITLINKGLIKKDNYTFEMKEVLEKCAETKKLTNGYFDIKHNGKLDPSGLVKGWAILHATRIIKNSGIKNYFVDAGGDIQTSGVNKDGIYWKVGIVNPLNQNEIVKVVSLSDCGIATSGNYIRGEHIYNPKAKNKNNKRKIVSLTVIGPNVYEADRFATAAFAMGEDGINFIGKLKGFEGYMIDSKGKASFTKGFEKYVEGN